jgi:hypothetical protein
MSLIRISAGDGHVAEAMDRVRSALQVEDRTRPAEPARGGGAPGVSRGMSVATTFVLLAALVGLPLLGVALGGGELRPYLAFPPLTGWVEHAPFSWIVFAVMAIGLVAFLVPVAVHAMRAPAAVVERAGSRRFPWWGWVGVVSCAVAWWFAWTRVPALAGLQRHSYTPLWFTYIVVVNAVAFARSGRCMMLNDTRFFIALFPVSAAFWWFFEVLNRFVQNWSYLNIGDFAAIEYVAFASLSFSTVLPAVLGTRDVLLTFPLVRKFDAVPRFALASPRAVAALALVFSGVGLLGLGLLPDGLFPLVWVAPGLFIVCAQVLAGRPTIFAPLARGEASGLVAACLAALVCGWFWEMWNVFSLAKWVYHIPFVSRFHVFEMPLLGFSGYLPFGLECLVVGEVVRTWMKRR